MCFYSFLVTCHLVHDIVPIHWFDYTRFRAWSHWKRSQSVRRCSWWGIVFLLHSVFSMPWNKQILLFYLFFGITELLGWCCNISLSWHADITLQVAFHPWADVSGVCERGPFIDEPMAWHNNTRFSVALQVEKTIIQKCFISLVKEKMWPTADQVFTRLGVNCPNINLEGSHTVALHDLWVHDLWKKCTKVSIAGYIKKSILFRPSTYG